MISQERIAELLSRLEQAEQHLDAALEANKRWAHRSSRERSELFKAEQAVARVLDACKSDSYDMHKDYGNGELVVPVDSIMYALDGDTRG